MQSSAGAAIRGQLGLGDTNHRGDGINEMGSNLNSINLASGSITQVEVGDGFACALKTQEPSSAGVQDKKAVSDMVTPHTVVTILRTCRPAM